MKIKDMIFWAYQNIKKRGKKTALSLIGILIAAFLITSILIISNGFIEDINKEMEDFGKDILIVLPYESLEDSFSVTFGQVPTIGKLFYRDIEAIKTLPIESVVGAKMGRANVEYKEKEIKATVYAYDARIIEQYPHMEIYKGRWIKKGEQGAAVLGYDATELFNEKIEINSKIKINNQEFRVVGILKRIGSSFSEADDNAIIVSLKEGEEIFKEQMLKEEVSFISIKGKNPTKLKKQVEDKLNAVRAKEDFTVITSDEIIEIVNSVLNTAQLGILVASVIAAIVGSIGIANTMIVTVEERKKEIGVMKTVGATKNTIIKLFIIESAMIGVLGGIIGSFLAVLLLSAQSNIPAKIDLINYFTPILIVTLVSAIAGAYPSKKAAEIDAIEALR